MLRSSSKQWFYEILGIVVFVLVGLSMANTPTAAQQRAVAYVSSVTVIPWDQLPDCPDIALPTAGPLASPPISNPPQCKAKVQIFDLTDFIQHGGKLSDVGLGGDPGNPTPTPDTVAQSSGNPLSESLYLPLISLGGSTAHPSSAITPTSTVFATTH